MARHRLPQRIAVVAAALACAAAAAWAPPARAQPAAAGAAGACVPAILAAADRHGIDRNILLAIGRVESGLTPWTINAAGEPHVFASRAEAVARTAALRAGGIASIDVGCMQVNLAWHPRAFADLDEAFDPEANADYAARFLRRLYRETGSWPAAMERYHSSLPGHRARYGCAVRAELAALRGERPQPCAAPPATAAAAAPVPSGPPGLHVLRPGAAPPTGIVILRGGEATGDAGTGGGRVTISITRGRGAEHDRDDDGAPVAE